VQRTGAGREAKEEAEAPRQSMGWEPVDPHAGIVFHARRGDYIHKGRPLATLYATTPAQLAESTGLLKQAIPIAKDPPPPPPPLIQYVFTRENAEAYLANADKVGTNRE
jgi:thymidine phosphorylase